MKMLAAAALAAAAVAAPALVQAQPSRLAEAYETICAANDAHADAAIAEARVHGFVTPPDIFTRSLVTSAGEIHDPIALWKTFDGGVVLIITGHMAAPGLNAGDAEVCAAIVLPGEPSPSLLIAREPGVGAPHAAGDQQMYVFAVDHEGGRHPVDLNDIGAVQRLGETGRLRIAAGANRAERGGTMSLLMLFAIRRR